MKSIGYGASPAWHISHSDCKPVKETNVYDHNRSERRQFYWIYLHCTTSSH